MSQSVAGSHAGSIKSGFSRASLNVTLPTTEGQKDGNVSGKIDLDRYSNSQGTIPPCGTPTNSRQIEKREVERIMSARIIERCWLGYRDRQMFRLLKHAVCAAENSQSQEILRKVCPKEAQFLKDKCVQCKVRFRFGGNEFPPLIYFKVYTSTSAGLGMKYLSGKRMIKPATEAAQDACDLMGQRLFLEQVIQDTIHQEAHKITDEVDVTTLKDYMQYKSLLDETPSYMGGRDNSWRKLTLEDLPRQTIFYDVVQFLYGRKLTQRLEEELPSLLIKPVNQDMQIRHMQIISEMRSPTPPMIHYTSKTHVAAPVTGRRTKKAKQRVQKMRKLYQQGYGDELVDVPESHYHPQPEQPQLEFRDDTWEQEADKLYEWTQELSLDDMMITPRIDTAPPPILS